MVVLMHAKNMRSFLWNLLGLLLCLTRKRNLLADRDSSEELIQIIDENSILFYPVEIFYSNLLVLFKEKRL